MATTNIYAMFLSNTVVLSFNFNYFRVQPLKACLYARYVRFYTLKL